MPQITRTRLAVAAAAVVVLGAAGAGIAVANSSSGDPAACEKAMREMVAARFSEAFTGQEMTKDAKKPAACEGLDDATLAKIGSHLFDQPSPSPS